MHLYAAQTGPVSRPHSTIVTQFQYCILVPRCLARPLFYPGQGVAETPLLIMTLLLLRWSVPVIHRDVVRLSSDGRRCYHLFSSRYEEILLAFPLWALLTSFYMLIDNLRQPHPAEATPPGERTP